MSEVTLSWATRTGENNFGLKEPIKSDSLTSSQKREIVGASLRSSLQADLARFAAQDSYASENGLKDQISGIGDVDNKDWDFTLNKDGDIEVIEGNDKLTNDEKSSLESVLNNSRFGYEFKRMAESLIEHNSVTNSSYEGTNLGKYKITMDNIGQVLKGKEYLESSTANSDSLATFNNQIGKLAADSGIEEKKDFIVHQVKIKV